MTKALRICASSLFLLGATAADAGSVTTASSGNVAAATATATLAAVAATTQFPAQQWEITGFEITAGGATAAAVVSPTITGLSGGTVTYTFGVPTGATLPAVPLAVNFVPPLDGVPGSAVVLSMPSLGTGNTNATVVIHGYLK